LTAAHNTIGRAQVLAKYLSITSNDNIPIGIGVKQDNFVGPLYDWASSYNLSDYKGGVYTDGVAKLIEILDKEPNTIFIEIAPTTNVQELLKRRPDLAKKLIVYAMSGSINLCYNYSPLPCAEYNVFEDISSAKKFYSTTYLSYMTTTPIDTGIDAIINETYYQILLKNQNANIILSTLLDNYRFWASHGGCCDPSKSSSILWDPVAIYLALTDKKFTKLVPYRLAVTNQGMTKEDPFGKHVNVAMSWLNLGQWKQWVVDLLLSK